MRSLGAVVPGRYATITARHDVIRELATSPQFLSGLPDEALPSPLRAAVAWARDPSVLTFLDRPSMLVTNGADHARLRRLTAQVFTSRAVAALATRVEDIADELLDTMSSRPDGEVVTEYAQVLPVLVIAEILGVPADQRARFARWTNQILPLTETTIGYPAFRRAEGAVRELNAWLTDHFTRLRAEPGPDLLSRLIRATDTGDGDGGGARLSEEELTVTAGLLLLAGFETTVNLIGNGTVLLLRHPEQRAHLQTHQDDWGNAVEEILRYDPPSSATIRHCDRDVAVADVTLPRHTLVVLLLAAANRDPAVFDNPDMFDVHRVNARDHLSFSLGPHYCLGAALARLEGQIGLSRLFARYPDMSLSREPTRRPSQVACGYSAIPVRLHGV